MFKVSKLNIILIILILLGPIFDLLTGYTLSLTGQANGGNADAVTPGLFYRGVFLIPVFLILAHRIKSPIRLLLYYFGFVFVAGLLLRSGSSSNSELLRDIQRFLKLMLPFIGFAGMLYVGQRYAKNKSAELFWLTAALYGAITALGLLTTDWIGLRLKVYRGATFASAGLIDSQNAAGLILIISFPIALYFVYKYRGNRMGWLLLVQALWLASAFQLNTRAVLVAIPAILVLHHSLLLIKGKYTNTSLRTVSSVALFTLTAVVAFFILQDWINRDVTLVLNRFELLAEGQFRSRIPGGIATIRGFTPVEHLFGQGDVQFSTTENDPVDIYGKFGLTVLLPILFFAGYFFFRLLRTFVRYKRFSTFTLLLSFILYFIHSATAGHALTTAPVNNLFLLIYFLCYLETKRYQPAAVLEPNTAVSTPTQQQPLPAGALAYDN